MAPPVLSSLGELKKLVDSVDTFLLDCDGVIYHGPVVVPGVIEVLDYLRTQGQLDALYQT
jgi:4-nitrophenyl phosphatase